jgi:hypothetical protein
MNSGFRYDADARMWVIEKTPGGPLDFGHDWTKWLDGDTLATSNWAVVPSAELTVVTSAIQGNKTVAWLQGGVVGREYRLDNAITTTGGRNASRSFLVRMVAVLSG